MKRFINSFRKNSRFLYYTRNVLAQTVPRPVLRHEMRALTRSLTERERQTVEDRVNYYNRLEEPFEPGPEAQPFRLRPGEGGSNYWFDLAYFTRYFDRSLRIHHLFGDIDYCASSPAICKSRPVDPVCRNNILLNLNKVRHFLFLRDRRSFLEKEPRLVWRGRANLRHREAFLSRFYGHPRCDVGHATRRNDPGRFAAPYLTIDEQLGFRYILSLEGADVATNLKWIMSSNSLCLMPRPGYETWFMEGRLEAGKHFVEIRDDFSDIEDKLDYYESNPGEALAIIRQANAFVAQFGDVRIEKTVSLLVLKKYFELSGQQLD